MRSILKPKKAQISFPIITFVFLLLALLILAPILLKFVTTPINALATAVNKTSPDAARAAHALSNSFASLFDYVLAAALVGNIILLFVTAFLSDNHPAFLVIYILGCAFLMIFAPLVLPAIQKIWAEPQFSQGSNNVVQYIPLQHFILDYFGVIILGIIVVTGIITYAKFKFSDSQGGFLR